VRAYSRPASVELVYDLFEPKEVKHADQSLVLCHGLFGSKQNWRSLAKGFAQRLGMPVYALDMRNHGMSPAATPHGYADMAADIAAFAEKAGIKSGMNLLGHSMGGKAVQAYALNKELNGNLRSLIAIDMSPATGKVAPIFMEYINAMREVEAAKVSSRADADKIMEKVEPDVATRQFLLTNVLNKDDGDGKSYLAFRVPLDIMAGEIPEIGGFPYTPPPPVSETSPQWEGPTLFLKGKKSPYINRKNIPICEAYFPNMQLVTLDAGHWVHADQPGETTDAVAKFIAGERVDNRE
jgi:pimeloyl-ACP methyl ester carboxylesterase